MDVQVYYFFLLYWYLVLLNVSDADVGRRGRNMREREVNYNCILGYMWFLCM